MSRDASRWYGWLVLGLFTGGWIGVMGFLGLGAAAALLASEVEAFSSPDGLLQLAERLQGGGLPPWLMAGTVIVQFPAMLALAETVRWLAWRGLDREEGALPPVRDAYALVRPSWRGLALGALLGTTTGWLPGWLAGWMAQLAPDWHGALEAVGEVFANGGPLTQIAMAVGVAVFAPVVEELVFRGLLWDSLSRSLSPAGVWVTTSLVFAAYHMDPFQAVPLLFTAFVLGWVRLRTGSLYPCIALHAVNNGLGVLGSVAGLDDASVGFGWVAGTVVLTLAMCAMLPNGAAAGASREA